MANNYIFKVFIIFSHQRKNYIWGWENSVLRKALASQIVDLSLTPIAPPKNAHSSSYLWRDKRTLQLGSQPIWPNFWGFRKINTYYCWQHLEDETEKCGQWRLRSLVFVSEHNSQGWGHGLFVLYPGKTLVTFYLCSENWDLQWGWTQKRWTNLFRGGETSIKTAA